jgi:hypothetical protein
MYLIIDATDISQFQKSLLLWEVKIVVKIKSPKRNVFVSFVFVSFLKVVILFVLHSLKYYRFVNIQTKYTSLHVPSTFANVVLSLLDIFCIS